MSTTEHTHAPAITRKPGRAANVGLWVLQAGLAVQFAGGGIMKVIGAPGMVEMFTDIGAGQWLRYVVGILEIAGAVGLLIPLLSSLAALGLAAVAVGAVITNVFLLEESPWLPLVLLVVAAVIAWARRSRTSSLVDMLRR
ncbi:DoxX family protein [Amycolatopsis sp. MtRt-6]|uniref:DoxX family protein n=1 Tax=Amycolatopsis sp. MtRt-6 TaxID=2792782 RepID=UPI001A8D7E6D|nr:DoxX family protein [Amycolatopsis sp. MtRt-6]